MKLEKYILTLLEENAAIYSFSSYDNKNHLIELLNFRNKKRFQNTSFCFDFYGLILPTKDFNEYPCILETLDEFYLSHLPDKNA